MKTYKIKSYDVWGNKTDGYEVNDVFHTGLEIELSEQDCYNDRTIIKKLKDIGFLKKGLHTKSFEITGEPGFSLYLTCVKACFGGFYPVCQLIAE